METRIRVQDESFDAGAEIKWLAAASRQVGGICSFVGTVREINEAADVSGLFLEHYPGMTEKQIATIMAEAGERWELLGATVIHRIGQLHPGDEIVFVGAASPHRGEAFDACEFMIDYLKTRATFWKKETTVAGDRWLTTRASDVATADAWHPGHGDGPSSR